MGFKVEFTMNDLSLYEQQEVYNILAKYLSINAKSKLHIVVTDPINGKHEVWNNRGIDPNGMVCKKCVQVDCTNCSVYKHREETKNGKNNSNT